MKINWKILIFSLFIVFLTAFIGNLFTSGNTNSSWYLENKPFFTPPNYIFPIAWSILYILIALSLYFVWVKSNKKDKKKIGIIYGINLISNALWSYLFFGIQNPLFAFIDILIILISIIVMILLSRKIDKKAAWLLLPYLLWVSFATVLNLAFVL